MSKLVERLVRGMAILGGLVLTILVMLVCISVLGRGLNTFGHWSWLEQTFPSFSTWLITTGVRPISGDFELVEAGIAFTIFSFLPYCQFYSGHATVDVFTSALSEKINNFLITFWEIVFAAVVILITWRLLYGMLGKLSNGETTFILEFPIWWAYAASFAAACVASFTSFYCALLRIANVLGLAQLPSDAEGAGQ